MTEVERLLNSFQLFRRPLTRFKISSSSLITQLHAIAKSLDVDSMWLIKNLAPVFPDAARYLRRKYGYSRSVEEDWNVASSSDLDKIEFINPSCNDNRRLHRLIEGLQSFDLSEEKQMSSFMHHVKSSKIVAALLQTNDLPAIGVREQPQFLSIRVDNAVGVLPLIPRVETDYLHRFFRQLKKFTGAASTDIVTLAPDSLVDFMASRRVKESFGNLKDVEKAMPKTNEYDEEGHASVFSKLSSRLTNGEFCHRASVFTLSRDSSTEAFRHEKIRVSLLYGYAKKYDNWIAKTSRFIWPDK